MGRYRIRFRMDLTAMRKTISLFYIRKVPSFGNEFPLGGKHKNTTYQLLQLSLWNTCKHSHRSTTKLKDVDPWNRIRRRSDLERMELPLTALTLNVCWHHQMSKIRLCFSIPRGSRDLAIRQINRKMKSSISTRSRNEKGPCLTVPLVLALRRH